MQTPIPINLREFREQNEKIEEQSTRDVLLSYIFVGFALLLGWLALAIL